MFKAFKERRPWAGALVNFIFYPFLGMLYLGCAGLAFGYLIISLAYSAVVFFYLFPSLAPAHDNLGVALLFLPLRLVGAIHGAIIARRLPRGQIFPRYSRWYSLLAITLIFVLAALIMRTFFYQPFDAPSVSMEPSINIGDYFWVSKRAYDRASPQRGDIIIFHWTDGDYVKRIAGVPGDKVQMVQGRLILNGKPLSQQRMTDLVTEDAYGITRPIRQYLETLPSGRSYKTLDLMDNSQEDNTSVFVVPAGSYFVLGDNRDNSNDSRMDVGFVPRGNIVGKVIVKFAERQHKTMIWEPVR